MNANCLMGEMIHHLNTINIPMTESFKYHTQAKITEDQALRQEEGRRAECLY